MAITAVFIQDGTAAGFAAIVVAAGVLLAGPSLLDLAGDLVRAWGLRSRLANQLIRWAGRLDPNRPVAFPNAPHGGFRINAGGVDLAYVSPGVVQTPGGSIEFGEGAVTHDQMQQVADHFEEAEVVPPRLNLPLFGAAPARTMHLNDLCERYRPGSGDWSWTQERFDLGQRTCSLHMNAGCYQRALEHYLVEGGELDPVLLGDDGRVHDGHHHIIAFLFLGRRNVPYITYADLKEDAHG